MNNMKHAMVYIVYTVSSLKSNKNAQMPCCEAGCHCQYILGLDFE